MMSRQPRLLRIVVVLVCLLAFTYYQTITYTPLPPVDTAEQSRQVAVRQPAVVEPSRFPLPVMDCSKLRSVITQPFPHPYRMYLHQTGQDVYISESVVEQADSGKYFEYPIRNHISMALAKHEHMVLLDIGANIGLHTAYFASLGHTIHAFEPVKANSDLLKCTVLANRFDNVRVNTFGLSTQAMTGCMDIPDGSNHGHAVVKNGDSSTCQNPVELRQLGDYLRAENIKPYLIKIDIEGHELKALSSAREYLRQHPPAHIFSEFAVPQLKEAGTQPLDYLNFLWDLGYVIEWSGHVLRSATEQKVAELLNTGMADIHAYRPANLSQ